MRQYSAVFSVWTDKEYNAGEDHEVYFSAVDLGDALVQLKNFYLKELDESKIYEINISFDSEDAAETANSLPAS